MPNYITTPLLSILGALIVAGIIGWLKRPRLAYLVPRLFTKSNLSDDGQLAEITILNRGFGNEEDVAVLLNPKLHYEVVGATTREYTFIQNKLTIPRLGSNQDVSFVLTIDGGNFSLTDIESCLSKATTGQGFSTLVEVPASAQSRLAAVITLVFFPLLIVGGIWGLNLFFGDDGVKQAAATAAADAGKAKEAAAGASADATAALNTANKALAATSAVVEVNDWKIGYPYTQTKGKLYEDFGRGAISVSFGEFVRKGGTDVVSIPILVKNLSDTPVSYTLSFVTAASEADERTPSYDRRLSDIFVAPNAASTKSVKVVLPRGAIEESQRTVWIEAFLESTDGDTLQMTRSIKTSG